MGRLIQIRHVWNDAYLEKPSGLEEPSRAVKSGKALVDHLVDDTRPIIKRSILEEMVARPATRSTVTRAFTAKDSARVERESR